MAEQRCTYIIEGYTPDDQGGERFKIVRRWTSPLKAKNAAKAYAVNHSDRGVMVVEHCGGKPGSGVRVVYHCSPEGERSPRCATHPARKARKTRYNG